MHLILLSGGSGKRLWPLSNDTRSKQFLKLLKNDSDKHESMVQRVYRQILESKIQAEITIATSASQHDSIKSQLGDAVDVVLEPSRRDTFPAISLACSYLHLVKHVAKDESVIVLPVDPYAETRYFQTLDKLNQIIRNDKANISLMGIKPTYPSAKYGYILPGETVELADFKYSLVSKFSEKPTEEVAAELIDAGALWNGGVFAFKIGYILDIIEKQISFNSYQDVLRQYDNLTKTSFDYAVVEKETSVAMVEYSGTWKDLGTWNTLTEVMKDSVIGNVLISDDCINTHVINELNIPITVLGIKNAIIASSADGILVSDKHQSSYIKPFVDLIQQRPMFEERRWGEYKVLSYDKMNDNFYSLTKQLIIKSGQCISYQSHQKRSEVWTIVQGSGYFALDGNMTIVNRGDVVKIDVGFKHGIKALSDLHIIEVQLGTELTEADIERFEWDWEINRIYG